MQYKFLWTWAALKGPSQWPRSAIFDAIEIIVRSQKPVPEN